jgi:NAD(P)H-dependent flavin oxidoreductase YrpB (nitropropane dioxygenase family)
MQKTRITEFFGIKYHITRGPMACLPTLDVVAAVSTLAAQGFRPYS